jgi:acetoin utilization deacetylase AcuC-like enzyme
MNEARHGHAGRRSFLKLAGGACMISFVPSLLRAIGGFAFAGDEAAPGKPPFRTGIVYSPVYKKHITGIRHPERPQRCDAIMNALEADKQLRLEKIEPRPATDAEIIACHTEGYLDVARRDITSGATNLSTGDTTVCKDSLAVALLAAGGTLSAVDAVFESKANNVFCAVRPPGHHARPAVGMGFCVFNNAAIAARYAQKKHKIGKVLIVDWDVHHGNGTQDIFYEDGSVFYFSTHQSPWYPGTGRADETGAGKGKGSTLNCPFSAGAGEKEIIGAFTDKLVPAANAFKPELVIISAGFDSRVGDPLGGFVLTDADFRELTKIMMTIADEHAGGRVVSVLEGGYSLQGLASAATAHVRTLAGK